LQPEVTSGDHQEEECCIAQDQGACNLRSCYTM